MQYKISVLIFLKNAQGKFLLLKRKKTPNQGLWSPIGGKLEMTEGESPFECAVRETKEETGLEISSDNLHLFCMATEKAYEGTGHWLMFLYTCDLPINELPAEMDEGSFQFYSREEIDTLPIPATDKTGLWSIYDQYKDDFVALKADCAPNKPLEFEIEQIIKRS